MITVVSGKLGSGKSHDVVRLMRDHVGRGGCVCTNITLDAAQIGKAVGRRVFSRQILPLSATMDPTTIPTGDRRGRGPRRTMVVLDEALNWFQSEGASEPGEVKERKRSWGEWLRQSDKLGQDVFFIAQNFERAAKWIRELAQVAREVVPLKDVRICWFIPLGLLFPPVRRMYSVVSWDVRSKARIGVEFHRYTPAVWRLYDTSETFGFVGADSAYSSVCIWPGYRPPLRPLLLCLVAVAVPAFLLVLRYV